MKHESNYLDSGEKCDNCGLDKVYWDKVPNCPALDDSNYEEEEIKE